jgi:hypothetical protein
MREVEETLKTRTNGFTMYRCSFSQRWEICYVMCHVLYLNQIIFFFYPVWWPGLNNSPTVTRACRKRRLERVPSAWGYSWATLSPGVINTEAWSSRLGVGRWTNNQAL